MPPVPSMPSDSPEPAYPAPPRLLVTVDTVIFTIRREALQVLLVKRRYDPFAGAWALPGGFVAPQESLEDAARRELLEETNLTDVYLEQLYTFGEVGRDPRDRVVSVAYFALIASDERTLAASTDAADVGWFSVYGLPQLAFDHAAIVKYALTRLRFKLDYTSVGFQLLPEKFTLTELQRMYEVILNKSLDKRNFRKKIASLDILDALDETKMEGPHRPAKLHAFREAGTLFWENRIVSGGYGRGVEAPEGPQ